MKKVISVSRRTDIPAFYGDWFMERVQAGELGCINPFGGMKYTVSLAKEDVLFIVFWSKNYRPFLPALRELNSLGYNFYCHFTINGMPEVLEPGVPPWEESVEVAHRIASEFSPDRVLWRFDPVLFSTVSPPEKVFERFTEISEAIEGATGRCYFSFVMHYGKVRRSFEKLHEEHGITFFADEAERKKLCGDSGTSETFEFNMTLKKKIEYAGRMVEIAKKHGISMHSCCGDYLNDSNKEISKAFCIDPELIGKILGEDITLKSKPTREGCGCYESFDIGVYNTCPHGCAYCYANMAREKAVEKFTEFREAKSCFSMSPKYGREEFPELQKKTDDLF